MGASLPSSGSGRYERGVTARPTARPIDGLAGRVVRREADARLNCAMPAAPQLLHDHSTSTDPCPQLVRVADRPDASDVRLVDVERVHGQPLTAVHRDEPRLAVDGPLKEVEPTGETRQVHQ